MSERGQLRASDADRKLVEDVLNTAYVDGRLTREEFDERIGRVWESRTFDDLAPLTSDLVATPPAAPVAARQPVYQTEHPQAAAAVVDPFHASPEVDRVSTFLGTHKRVDAWRMRQRTSVNAVMGDVVLDLSKATLEGRDLHIQLSVFLGDVKIRVPAGVRVVNNVSCFLGDTRVAGTRPGDVTLTLSGTCLMGDFKVLGPDERFFTEKIFGRL